GPNAQPFAPHRPARPRRGAVRLRPPRLRAYGERRRRGGQAQRGRGRREDPEVQGRRPQERL
ncbi:MAG: hypothetical protein AVDCRST_MAG79-1285, partial [uncultured Thermoleophilia bacterium]